jgi:citrate lyase subunit alpha/citrate CoA-transferase
VIVTEYGAAVNPARPDLAAKLRAAGIGVRPIVELRDQAAAIVGRGDPIAYTDKVVGIVTYRDGTVIDLVRQVR